MTLEELENTLPNGLHDAEIKSISIDYGQSRAILELTVWIGDMNRLEAPVEAYRDAKVTFEGIYFFAIEPPHPDSGFAEAERLQIDVTHERKRLNALAVGSVPSDCFVSGLFVQEWNSFIVVAARDATLEWMGEMVDREPEP